MRIKNGKENQNDLFGTYDWLVRWEVGGRETEKERKRMDGYMIEQFLLWLIYEIVCLCKMDIFIFMVIIKNHI